MSDFQYQRKEVVNCPLRDAFCLIYEVEKYPLFLPYCQKAVIFDQKKDRFQAELLIVHPLISFSFISDVTSCENSIQMHSIKGPFRKLEGFWHFRYVSFEETEISFHIHIYWNHFFEKLAFLPFSSVFSDLFFLSFSKEISKRKS